MAALLTILVFTLDPIRVFITLVFLLFARSRWMVFVAAALSTVVCENSPNGVADHVGLGRRPCCRRYCFAVAVGRSVLDGECRADLAHQQIGTLPLSIPNIAPGPIAMNCSVVPDWLSDSGAG